MCETSNHCKVFGERLFGLELMLLHVLLQNAVECFRLTPEQLQCFLGFVKLVDLLVVSSLQLNASP